MAEFQPRYSKEEFAQRGDDIYGGHRPTHWHVPAVRVRADDSNRGRWLCHDPGVAVTDALSDRSGTVEHRTRCPFRKFAATLGSPREPEGIHFQRPRTGVGLTK